jgi:hypothetical protein
MKSVVSRACGPNVLDTLFGIESSAEFDLDCKVASEWNCGILFSSLIELEI